MKRSQTLSLLLIVSGALLASNALAQTPQASGSTQTPAAKPESSSGTAAASKPQSTAPAKRTAGAATAKPGAAAAPALKTNREKASYAFGVNLARNLKQEGVEIDSALLARGFKDGSGTGKLLLTDEEAQAALMAYSGEVRKKKEAELAVVAAANQKAGQAFLDANKAKPGVVTLPSGLEYKVLTAGTGPKPTAADTVVCNYRGTLISGKEFDNSAKHGGAADIPVGGVIKGWTEALQLMPVGSKWELYIPGDLAYGPRQAGPDIGPNSTLIFEVELVSIKEKPKAEEKPAADPKDARKPAGEPAAPAAQPAPAQPTPPQPAPKPPSR